MSCPDEDGMSHLSLNLSDSVLLEDKHLICFADYRDAFGYTQLLKANGDDSDFG